MSSSPPNNFGQLVRSQREKLGLGLREFCVKAGLDPAYLSRIERGLLSPPQDPDRLRELAEALGLLEGSKEGQFFKDAASLQAGRLPPDIRNDEAVLNKLPVLFRTIRG